jgi:hypothetical protein
MRATNTKHKLKLLDNLRNFRCMSKDEGKKHASKQPVCVCRNCRDLCLYFRFVDCPQGLQIYDVVSMFGLEGCDFCGEILVE